MSETKKDAIATQEEELSWFDPLATEGLRVYGFAWFDRDHRYMRFPAASDELVRKVSTNVANLSGHSAGGQVHFRTDSDTVAIMAEIAAPSAMPHMTIIGQGGFDCYAGCDYQDLKFFTTTTFPISARAYQYRFFTGIPGEKLIVINFPLYNKVESVKIGLKPGALLKKPEELPQPGRIVVYGTSITQGGCASRPGLCYTNILSRKLGIEFINLGFSGSAFGEPEIAELVAAVDGARMFILDYEANAGSNGRLYLTLEDFIKIIRRRYPDVPIAVVSRIRCVFAELNPETAGKMRRELKEFQMKTVDSFREKGDKAIYFIDGATLFPDDYHEFTVDSNHPNDIGFYWMAAGLEKEIRKIINI